MKRVKARQAFAANHFCSPSNFSDAEATAVDRARRILRRLESARRGPPHTMPAAVASLTSDLSGRPRYTRESMSEST